MKKHRNIIDENIEEAMEILEPFKTGDTITDGRVSGTVISIGAWRGRLYYRVNVLYGREAGNESFIFVQEARLTR